MAIQKLKTRDQLSPQSFPPLLRWMPWAELLRQKYRDTYRTHMEQQVEPYALGNLSKSALIVAPHPDDETLGCGGTILKKRQMGASVQIVFMTDGQRSHAHLLSSSKLKELRRQEAIAACHKLGVAEDQVHFLDVPDGSLETQHKKTISCLTKLIQAYSPQELFMPYAHDPNADHIATTQAIRMALHQHQQHLTCYEYPVWVWFHWPWVRLPVGSWTLRKQFLHTSVKLWFGSRMHQTFRTGVPICDVREDKWRALTEHRTQMTELLPDCHWQTLHDVADGEWLRCFFYRYEFFRRTYW